MHLCFYIYLIPTTYILFYVCGMFLLSFDSTGRFPRCPIQPCTLDILECPDGTFVTRDPKDNVSRMTPLKLMPNLGMKSLPHSTCVSLFLAASMNRFSATSRLVRESIIVNRTSNYVPAIQITGLVATRITTASEFRH